MKNTCLLRPADSYPYGGIAASGVYFRAPGVSTSGYDTRVENHLHRLADGGVFLDKRPVPDADLVSVVMSGPVLDLNLPPATVDRFRDRQSLAHMLPGLGGSFRDFAVAALRNKEWSGLDSISLDLYLALWLGLGAVAGTRKGDSMEWSDGRVTDIPACTCWHGVCLGCNCLRYYVDPIPGAFPPATRQPRHPQDHCPECKRKQSAA